MTGLMIVVVLLVVLAFIQTVQITSLTKRADRLETAVRELNPGGNI